ncbi:hypothetical protein NQ317_017318 [Molorchus minor]|uniref:LEM domain-containing protein n=1 Tax=Molorchus minor TaxID=1323400 RepID=A0ABQ9K1B7_9CUCU|nr:hypothetical protein NQ317_017318 [Molorchus minor]
MSLKIRTLMSRIHMVDVDKLSDAELRTKLLEFGFPLMPITGTTRKIMVKKLKLLLENKAKSGSDSGRRSLGNYSSEEDSEPDVKTIKKRENRRATMAAPIMQPPPTTTRGRKSNRLNETPEPENIRSLPKREIRTATSTTSTRTQKTLTSSQDDFDTGSDSESDIVTNSYNSVRGSDLDYKKSSPIRSPLSSFTSSTNKYSPPKTVDTSYNSTRNVAFSSANASPSRSYNSPSVASDYATDRLNQIRSRLSLGTTGYDRPLYSTSSSTPEKEETPFLSNFTRRLSALSGQKNDVSGYNNDIIKEHDTNGSSYARSQLSRNPTRGRDTYSYKLNQNSILKNNFVSFAVLAGAALFFVFLAIMYLGMRSDTSVVPSGLVIPHCVLSDPHSKKGVNCLIEEDVSTAIHLLNVIKPELQKKAIANECFDATLKPHMTEAEIVTFCKTNFAIRDEKQIRNDLRNLEILCFDNPDWGINIVQTENNNGFVSEENIAKNMEQLVFNHQHKITSLIIFNPDLPWKCTFYKTFYTTFYSCLVIALLFGLIYLSNLGLKYYRHFRAETKR